MKRILLLLLATVLVVSAFVGCQGTDEEIDSSQEDAVVEEVEDEEEEPTEEELVQADPVEKTKVFVTSQWVKSLIDGQQEESEDFVILEASWGSEEDSPDYLDGHIPGAIHVDTSSIEEEPLWNLKSPEDIEAAILEVGATKDTTVVIYGANESGASRVAYAYLWAGVENVKVLDGGLNAWKEADYPLETESNQGVAATDFGATVPVHPEYWLSIEDAAKKLEEDENFRLVSIRAYDEFIGETSGYSYIDKAGEPKGAVWGMGGSDSSSIEDYLREDGTFIDLDEMIEMWEDLDFSIDNELSFYCGTGWRAAVPFLIMYENGYTNMNMFDGGWYEWQMDDERPVQVGDPNGGDVLFTTVGELPDDKAWR